MSTIKIIHDIINIKRTRLVFKRWSFMSFSGHYSDSPKYLSIKLHELYPDIEIVWHIKPQYNRDLPKYVIAVEYGTEESKKLISSSDVIIDNVYGGRAFNSFRNSLPSKLKAKILKYGYLKRGQRIYTTWHGTPLKKMGRDQIGNDVTGFECCNIKMLLGNQFTSGIMRHLSFDSIPIKVLGTPKNDTLFIGNSAAIKAQLGLPIDKKTILFAPTFRNDGKDIEGKNVNRSGIDQLNMIDFDKLFEFLKDKFGGDWVMICRFHYHVAELVDWEDLDKKYNGRIINGNLNDDMAEYLSCADILITDASSCMFDFVLTNRPCFLFFPDIKNYANKERGFYLSTDSLPFPVSTTFEELISDIDAFNPEEYAKEILTLKNKLGYYEDGRSSERIVEWIVKDAGY